MPQNSTDMARLYSICHSIGEAFLFGDVGASVLGPPGRGGADGLRVNSGHWEAVDLRRRQRPEVLPAGHLHALGTW